jgi:hypothetical protein
MKMKLSYAQVLSVLNSEDPLVAVERLKTAMKVFNERMKRYKHNEDK